jgi:hypothetical protein
MKNITNTLQEIMPKKTKTKTQPTPEENEVKLINFDKFDLDRFALKARSLAEQKESTQYMCFPKYAYDGDPEGENIMENGESPLVVTDDIVINKGGIPRFNEKYHASQDAMGRAYFYLAKDDTCPGSIALFDWIKVIDDHYDQKINKEGNKEGLVSYTVKSKTSDKEVKKPFKGLTYKRIITTTRKPKTFEEEDEDPNKKEYIPYERIKVKFSTIWDASLGANDLKDINTMLFIPGSDEPVDATRVSDFDKHFTWKSTCKFGLMLNKFWIDKSDERNCSFGLKCVQLAVTNARPDTQTKTASTQLSRNLFTGKKFNKVDEDVTKKEVKGDSGDEDSGDEDEAVGEDINEEDDEAEEESEEDDDAKSDNEDEDGDESEEEEEPVKKSKKVSKSKKVETKNVKVKAKATKKPKKSKKLGK